MRQAHNPYIISYTFRGKQRWIPHRLSFAEAKQRIKQMDKVKVANKRIYTNIQLKPFKDIS